MTFYEKIKELRLNKKVSQQEVADFLEVTKQAYSLYELGKRNVDNEALLKLSEYFGVSVDYLLGKTDNKPEVSDDDIKFALFGGDGEITDEMYNDVKNFAQFIKEKYKDKKG